MDDALGFSKVKVFISWSGTKSREVAVAFRDWLPLVINSVEPFVSSKDIYAGTRWQLEIAAQLEATNFGIVCVTKENQRAPWLNFEAGALAKAVDASRVVPLAIDLKPSDIELPLGQFQGQPTTELGVTEIVNSINAASASPLLETLLKKSVAKWWPDLEVELQKIEAKNADPPSSTSSGRTERELLEETLNTVRALARSGLSARRAPSGAAIAKSHPVIEELRNVLAGVCNIDEVRILHHSNARRLGIRTQLSPLPDEVQEELRQMAELYGISLDFLSHKLRPTRRDPLSLDEPGADDDEVVEP